MKSALTRRHSSSRLLGPRSPNAKDSEMKKHIKTVTFDKTDEIIRYEIQTPDLSEENQEFSNESKLLDNENRPLPHLPADFGFAHEDHRLEQLMKMNPKYTAELQAPVSANDGVDMGKMGDSDGSDTASNSGDSGDAANSVPTLPSPIEIPMSPIIDRPPMDVRIDAIMEGGSKMSPVVDHQTSHKRQESNSSVQSEPEYEMFKPSKSHNRQLSLDSVDLAQWRTQNSPGLARQDSLQEDQKQLPTKTDSLLPPPAREESYDNLASYNDRRRQILKLLDPQGPGTASKQFNTIIEEEEEEPELVPNPVPNPGEETVDVHEPEEPEEPSQVSTHDDSTPRGIPKDISMISTKLDFGEDANWLGGVLNSDLEFNTTIQNDDSSEVDVGNDTIGISNEPAALYAAGLSPELEEYTEDSGYIDTVFENATRGEPVEEPVHGVHDAQEIQEPEVRHLEVPEQNLERETNDVKFDFDDKPAGDISLGLSPAVLDAIDVDESTESNQELSNQESSNNDSSLLEFPPVNVNKEVPSNVVSEPEIEANVPGPIAEYSVVSNMPFVPSLSNVDSTFRSNETTIHHSVDSTDQQFYLRDEHSNPSERGERSDHNVHTENNVHTDHSDHRQLNEQDEREAHDSLIVQDIPDLTGETALDVTANQSTPQIPPKSPERSRISNYPDETIDTFTNRNSILSGIDSPEQDFEVMTVQKLHYAEPQLRISPPPSPPVRDSEAWVEASSLSSLDFSSESSLHSPVKADVRDESKFSIMDVGPNGLPTEAIDYIQRNSPLLSNEEFEEQLHLKPMTPAVDSFAQDVPPEFFEVDLDSELSDFESKPATYDTNGNPTGSGNYVSSSDSAQVSIDEPSFGENMAESMRSMLSDTYAKPGYVLRDNGQVLVTSSPQHRHRPSEGYEVVNDEEQRYNAPPPSIPRNRNGSNVSSGSNSGSNSSGTSNPPLSLGRMPSYLSRRNSSVYSDNLYSHPIAEMPEESPRRPNFETVHDSESTDRSTVLPSFITRNVTSSTVNQSDPRSKFAKRDVILEEPRELNEHAEEIVEKPANEHTDPIDESIDESVDLPNAPNAPVRNTQLKLPVSQGTIESISSTYSSNYSHIEPSESQYHLPSHRSQESIALESAVRKSLQPLATISEQNNVEQNHVVEQKENAVDNTANKNVVNHIVEQPVDTKVTPNTLHELSPSHAPTPTPGLLYLHLNSLAIQLKPLPSNTIATLFIDNGHHVIETSGYTLAQTHKLKKEYRVTVFNPSEINITLKLTHAKQRFKRTIKVPTTPDGSFSHYSGAQLCTSYGQELQTKLQGLDVWQSQQVNTELSVSSLFIPCALTPIPQTMQEAQTACTVFLHEMQNRPEMKKYTLRQYGGDASKGKGKTRQFEFDGKAPLLIAFNMDTRPRALISLDKIKSVNHIGVDCLELNFKNSSNLALQAQNAEQMKEFESELNAARKLPKRARWLNCVIYENL